MARFYVTYATALCEDGIYPSLAAAQKAASDANRMNARHGHPQAYAATDDLSGIAYTPAIYANAEAIYGERLSGADTVCENEGTVAHQGIYTKLIEVEGGCSSFVALVKPDQDLDNRFRCFDIDSNEWLMVNGWNCLINDYVAD